jgi:RNA polymerase sigma-70 factor, ECF subfamily
VQIMPESFNLDAVLDAVDGGNTAAFMQLVDAYGLMVRSYVGSHVYSAADIDDLAQETFIAAYRALRSFRRGDDFGAWLRGIARNRVLMFFRGTRRRISALQRFRGEVAGIVDHELDAASREDQSRHIAALMRCVSKLPARLRRVVRSGLDGTKPRALAEDFQTSTAAVYQLHYRANQLLRECLKREVYHDA